MAYFGNDENSNTLISGTSGNDDIYNGYSSNVTINAGNGDDTVENEYSDKTKIYT